MKWTLQFHLRWWLNGFFVAVNVVSVQAADVLLDDVDDDGLPVLTRTHVEQRLIQADERLRHRLELNLQMEIEYLERQVKLSDRQRAALLLAGRGDIKRHRDAIAELRRGLHDKSVDHVINNAEIFREVAVRENELSIRVHDGLHGKQSLFAKVLQRTLLPDQQAKFVSKQWRTSRDNTTFYLAGVLKLSHDQSAQLQRLVAEEVLEPSQQYSTALAYLLSQLAKVPDKRFAKFLDESQLKRLKAELVSVRELPVGSAVNDGDEVNP